MHSITHNQVCEKTVRMYERIVERSLSLDSKDKTLIEQKWSEDKNRLQLKFKVGGIVFPLVIVVDKFPNDVYLLYYSGDNGNYRAMLRGSVTSVEDAIDTILERPFTLTCQNDDLVAYVKIQVFKHVEDGSFMTVCYGDRSFIARKRGETTRITIYNKRGQSDDVDWSNDTDDVRKVVKTLYSLSAIGDIIHDLVREEPTLLRDRYKLSDCGLRATITSKNKKTSLSIVASEWEGMITLDWFEGNVRQGRVEGVPELICFASATRAIVNNWMKSADQ